MREYTVYSYYARLLCYYNFMKNQLKKERKKERKKLIKQQIALELRRADTNTPINTAVDIVRAKLNVLFVK